MRNKKIHSFLFLLCFIIPTAFSSNSAISIRLGQVQVALPKLTAYLDVREGKENVVHTLRPEQLRVTLSNQVLGVTNAQPFSQSGEGVGYIMLVDVSKSVRADFFGKNLSALTRWIDRLADNDRLAILSFGDAVNQVSDFSNNKEDLKLKLATLHPTDAHTALHDALIKGIQLGKRFDKNIPVRRVIIVLSDGLDDLLGGPVRDEVSEHLKIDRIPLYVIGQDTAPVPGHLKVGIETLGRFARESGGEYLSAANRPLETVYADLFERIRSVYVLQLNCVACIGDGSVKRLQLTAQFGGVALSDGSDVRVLPSELMQQSETITASVPTQLSDNLSVWARLLSLDPAWKVGIGVMLLILIFISAYITKKLVKRFSKKSPHSALPVSYSIQQDVNARMMNLDNEPPRKCLLLLQINGINQGQQYLIDIRDEIIIGRSPHADVTVLGDSLISSQHCIIIRRENGLYVRDLNSTNGTGINGVAITGDTRIHNSDELYLGATRLQVLEATI